MPTQPNPNPINKPPQPIYHSEVINLPTYPINSVELNGVHLRSRNALKGPTIIEVSDEPKEELEKEPPFPDRFIHKPELKEPTHSKF